MENKSEKKLYGSVLLKSAKILDALAEEGGKTIQDLSKKTSITSSNLSKILETLIVIGYVIRDESKFYYLGTKFMEYNTQNIDAKRLLAISRPYLEELRSVLNETIHLSVLENNKIVYIDKLEPKNQGIYMTSRIGMARPLYSSGMGKAVLSTFNQAHLSEYLDGTELVQLAKNTITDRATLEKELIKISKQGFSIDDEEQEDDGYCVAVTIERNSKVIGAMSVSFPKFRFSEEYRRKVVTELKDTKEKIEARLR
ncbi:IclR family transcriptional regulator [Enterococcus gilvus]|uniref:IclR transcriptional regulator n=1 Tax=Enterococcus gilvus ATCC BAA-350 TaxID=1158614 RepID=R2XDX1_9ENTE|nr:IclR family transcriptional regulator [Enterococcus gilvus]EOI53019.1 hypothetical protein UKC_04038 [Enterococcus gilvus ATCC BAA-350]EOW77613.1 hypothetical protein I592_04133 [Enterococcus gilvus ATCC BAA-350]